MVCSVVVGFQTSSGLVIPLSLACLAPESLGDEVIECIGYINVAMLLII